MNPRTPITAMIRALRIIKVLIRHLISRFALEGFLESSSASACLIISFLTSSLVALEGLLSPLASATFSAAFTIAFSVGTGVATATATGLAVVAGFGVAIFLGAMDSIIIINLIQNLSDLEVVYRSVIWSSPKLFSLMDSRSQEQPESPLLTDRYLLTMCYSWMKSGMIEQKVVYEWFYRKNPFDNNYLLLCGVNQAVDWLKRVKFTRTDIEYVQKDLKLDAKDNFLSWLEKVEFSSLKVYAVKEGSFVFPHLPMMIVEGPLGMVQLCETMLLNKLNYPCLIATNARLLVNAIGEKRDLLEFGLRRAQGPNGGLTGALYACIGGATATSNMLAGEKYGVPTVGTMAHSFVTSFRSLKDLEERKMTDKDNELVSECLNVRQTLCLQDTHEGELAAFISFALDFPESFVALVDSYDSLKSGVPNFCIVAIALERKGGKAKGLRLDSGDLAALSISTRALMEKFGSSTGTQISKCRIVASDDLSIQKIKAMKGNHSIDTFAVGTKLITCYEQAALGMVCKLCHLNGTPRMKFADVPEKSTLPGKKQTWRVLLEADGKTEHADILATFDEVITLEQKIIVYPVGKYDSPRTVTVKKTEPLLIDVEANVQLFKFDYLQSKQNVEKSIEQFSFLKEGQTYPVYVSTLLKDLLFQLRQELKMHDK